MVFFQMGHRGKNDLLRLLSTFADNYIDKTDIAQSDWSSSIGSWKEKRKFGFNLMLQIISAAYADLLEDQTEKKSTNQVHSTIFSVVSYVQMVFITTSAMK